MKKKKKLLVNSVFQKLRTKFTQPKVIKDATCENKDIQLVYFSLKQTVIILKRRKSSNDQNPSGKLKTLP